MRKSRFTEEQIIGVLKDHQAGLPVTELCRKHGISDATFYNWRSRYGGMEISDAKRLKALEEENRKLKKLLAELVLDVATLKEALEKTSDARLAAESCDLGDQREELFAAACLFAAELHRRCPLPSRWRRRCGSPRLRALAAERRRFGYRRAYLLRREGIMLNHKKLSGSTARNDWLCGGVASQRLGNARANDVATGSEPALEPGLRPDLATAAARVLVVVDDSPANAWRWWWIHRCPSQGGARTQTS